MRQDFQQAGTKASTEVSEKGASKPADPVLTVGGAKSLAAAIYSFRSKTPLSFGTLFGSQVLYQHGVVAGLEAAGMITVSANKEGDQRVVMTFPGHEEAEEMLNRTWTKAKQANIGEIARIRDFYFRGGVVAKSSSSEDGEEPQPAQQPAALT